MSRSIEVVNTNPSVGFHLLTLEALHMIKNENPHRAFPASPYIAIAKTVLSMLLKYGFKKLKDANKKEVDIISVIQETLLTYTTEWLESEYQAVRKDAHSLVDAIESYQDNPTNEARQLVVVRNEITITAMRRLCILSINAAKKHGAQSLSSVCALSCLLYFFTLRDTIANGLQWGYTAHDLQKYSKALVEQADIMFTEVLTADINNYNSNDFYKPESQAKRSMIYWTSDYTNIQEHLSVATRRKPSRVCLSTDDKDNLYIAHDQNTIFLGDVFLNDSNSDNDGSYNYLSATEPRSYTQTASPITLEVKSAGRYRMRMYYAEMADSLSFDYETKIKLQQSNNTLIDIHLRELSQRILTPYNRGSNYGPVIYREKDIVLEKGSLVLHLHNDRYISGQGYIQHIEFLGI